MPPLKKSCPEITKEERFVGKQRTVNEPLLWSQRHEGRHDHILHSKVGIVPTINEILQTETSFRVGSALTPLLGKKDVQSIQSHFQNHKDKYQ
jgi:hypothetical protein